MLFEFPFPDDTYELTMDARAGVKSLVHVEPDKYHEQLALKQSILTSDPGYYFQCPLDAEPLAWEALEVLLPDMARVHPQLFTLERRGDEWTWTNRLLSATTMFRPGDVASLPRHPLDWLGRQVQEDLILMAAHDDGETVVAGGHLCFASGWSLGDKMGHTFADVHAPVPEFAERIGQPADLLLRRLKSGRPVGRVNATFHATDQLNLAPKLAGGWTKGRREITPENAGERCFLRLERQTLSRLPRTNGALFTIHTSVHAIAEVSADPTRARRLAAFIRSIPPAMREYKGMTLYADALLAYLDVRAQPVPLG